MSEDTYVEGLDKLAEAMDALPPRVGKAAARPALSAGAEVFLSALQQTVPRDTGELAEALDKKITVSSDLSRMSAVVGPRYMGGYKFTSTDPGVRAKFLEFGTRKMPPQFWVRKAYEMAKDVASDAVIGVLRAVMDALPKS